MNKEAKILLGIAAAVIIILVVVGIIYGNTKPKPEAVDPQLLVRDTSPAIKATEEEKVVLVEFSDFQCPACGAMEPTLASLIDDYQENLTFVYRHFPLRSHKHAEFAALASEAAAEQGKFWEMHDMLFERQEEWGSAKTPLEEEAVRQKFIDYATELELNVEQFTAALDNETYKDRVNVDKSDGNQLNVDATPTFYVNGYKTEGSDLEQAITEAINNQ